MFSPAELQKSEKPGYNNPLVSSGDSLLTPLWLVHTGKFALKFKIWLVVCMVPSFSGLRWRKCTLPLSVTCVMRECEYKFMHLSLISLSMPTIVLMGNLLSLCCSWFTYVWYLWFVLAISRCLLQIFKISRIVAWQISVTNDHHEQHGCTEGHIHIHRTTHAQTCAHTFKYLQTHTYTHTHTHTHTQDHHEQHGCADCHTHKHADTRTHTHTHTHTCTQMHTHTHTRMCSHTCTHTLTYTPPR